MSKEKDQIVAGLIHFRGQSSPTSMAAGRPKTSCKECRITRLGCDAAAQKPGRCSNCVRRGKTCISQVRQVIISSCSNRLILKGGGCWQSFATPHAASTPSVGVESSSADNNPEPSWLNINSNGNATPDTATGAAVGSVSEEIPPQSLGLQSPTYSNAFPTPSPSSFDLESIACRRLQANMLSDLLWDIYFKTFETRYMTWLENSCRPYLGMTAPVSGFTPTRSAS